MYKNNLSFAKIPCTSENLASLINVIEAGEISGKQGKVVFEEVMQGKDPKKVIEEKGMKQVSDDGAILAIVQSVLDANPQSIEDFKNGKYEYHIVPWGSLIQCIEELNKHPNININTKKD